MQTYFGDLKSGSKTENGSIKNRPRARAQTNVFTWDCIKKVENLYFQKKKALKFTEKRGIVKIDSTFFSFDWKSRHPAVWALVCSDQRLLLRGRKL